MRGVSWVPLRAADAIGGPTLEAVSSTPAVVRPAGPGDASALAELAAVTFPLACPPGSTAADQKAFLDQHLSAARFAQYAADAARDLIVAEASTSAEPGPGPGPEPEPTTALLGYAMLVAGEPTDPDVRAAVRDRPAVELSKMYVHPDHHGTGVATALMSATLDAARGRGAAVVWLGVNQLNARAQAFYARSGFVRVGTKHFEVGTRIEDDYVLARTP